MLPEEIAALVAQLLPSLIALYQQIAANHASVPPLATALASADADWDSIAATAKGQLNASNPAPPAA